MSDSSVGSVNMTTAQPLNNFKDLLSVEDLSAIFEVSKQTIYKELKNGKFGTPIQIGRSYKVPKVFVLEQYFQVSCV